MKPKEFVEKHKLDVSSERFNQKEFLADFELEFASLLQVGKAKENILGFENAVRALRMKWDAISNKSKTGLPEKIWKYFYATSIIPTKEALFPNEMNRRREEQKKREERRRFHEEYNAYFFNSFRDSFYAGILSQLLAVNEVPEKEFSLLSLNPSTATVEDVQREFKQASLRCHPDHGGTDAQMCDILEARKKCLIYIDRNHR